jgi:hypothetical protein
MNFTIRFRLDRNPFFIESNQALSPEQKRNLSYQAIFYCFIACVFVIGMSLIEAALLEPTSVTATNSVAEELDSLAQTHNIQQFLKKKLEFKSSVYKALWGNSSTFQKNEAYHAAVYLFPDLLSGSSLEKEIGEKLWGNHQKIIESNPKSVEGQEAFQKLRANLWNYENPDRLHPSLSHAANKVLNIYRNLSANE